MSDFRVELQTAVVIHQRPFKNTSAIVDFFTRDYGRMAAVVQGAKREKSKWRGLIQPFQLLQISWQGRGELPKLIAAESLGQIHFLTGEALFSALYVNELLMRLLQKHDAMPVLFDQYLRTIEQLLAENSVESLRCFELCLLQCLGYELPLQYEAGSDVPIEPDRYYRLVIGEGFVASEVATMAIAGSSLLAIARKDFSSPQVAKDAKYIVRMALQRLLGDKPLKSRELLLAYKAKR
ncbi:MAG: DNA repair protein RecO [Gammaproteobacteria bacterium]|nr:DNA repair protein RecO [Gammaproteobacteria bacterium]